MEDAAIIIWGVDWGATVPDIAAFVAFTSGPIYI